MTEQATTEKRLYKNNTGGWLGVVMVDHDGKAVGTSIEPFGTIWLSDAEAILTARAPKDPANNPFVSQTFMGIDGNGAKVPFLLVPLTLEADDSRYVPTNDRFVPIFDAAGRVAAEAAAKSAEPGPITTAAAAASEAIVADAQPAPVAAPPAGTPADAPAPAGSVAEPPPPPPVAPQGGPVPIPQAGASPAPPTSAQALQGADAPDLAATGPDDLPEPLYTEPQAPGEVLRGSLSGSNEPAPDPAATTAPPPPAAAAVPAQTVPTAPGGVTGSNEPQPDAGFPTVHAPPPAPLLATHPQVPLEPRPAGDTSPIVEGSLPPGAMAQLGSRVSGPIESAQAAARAQEEHAAAVDPQIGEETGAAKPPAGPPAEGEFAQAEEVGSPEAPASE